MIYRCPNATCSEHDVDKAADPDLINPDLPVFCGKCGEPCEQVPGA